MSALISVIIPAYNNLVGVMTALNSLQALADASDIEYIVQDDASPDVHFPACIPSVIASVERNAVNLGFAGNCNAGAARASGDILFFVNHDVYGVHGWSNGWAAALVAAFAADVGIVGARLLFPDGKVQNAGGVFDGRCQPHHRCIGWSNPHHPDVSQARDVSWTTGAAFAARRELWTKIGGFDSAYGRGYFEDVDFCVRAQLEGARVRYAPEVTFVHQVGSSGGNPRFMDNARLFKTRWVDTGIIESDVPEVMERFW